VEMLRGPDHMAIIVVIDSVSVVLRLC
jgi:hypothetical protein